MHKVLRRACSVGFLVVFLGLFSHAQQAQPDARRALLWKVTSPTATVYLLGSIHVVEKGMYPLAKPVEDAFAASKILAVEVNLRRFSKEELASMVQSRATYSDGSTISQHITKPTSDLLD